MGEQRVAQNKGTRQKTLSKSRSRRIRTREQRLVKVNDVAVVKKSDRKEFQKR